ncbi:MAG: sulfatase-like hydrolase/transferase, partial [Muribaculaceae bacterium]|nr:sulfatase-like hydrolase/transferase [Muribaculaceae bacterium]
VYEGGVREPMIVRWPGVTAPGSETDAYVMIEDFFPTILEMAGCADAQASVVQTVDGVSFMPLLTGRGENPAHGRSIYWHTPNSWIAGDYRDQGIGATSAVRRGDYKLVYWWIDGRKELYDLRADIGEGNDIAATNPRLVAELSADLGRYLRSVDAQRPKLAATGEYCQWPDGDDCAACQ